jgi:hypothetical protein
MEHITGQSRLSDRQARALIVAAEARGFEREPDLPERVRDADLHFDAVAALEYLLCAIPRPSPRSTGPDPISPDIGARRIVNGRVTAADAQVLIDAARARGCSPTGSDLPLTEYGQLFAKAEEAVAFFWAEDPDELVRMLGDGCRLSPLPRSQDET